MVYMIKDTSNLSPLNVPCTRQYNAIITRSAKYSPSPVLKNTVFDVSVLLLSKMNPALHHDSISLVPAMLFGEREAPVDVP
jgi:hypothetical protein